MASSTPADSPGPIKAARTFVAVLLQLVADFLASAACPSDWLRRTWSKQMGAHSPSPSVGTIATFTYFSKGDFEPSPLMGEGWVGVNGNAGLSLRRGQFSPTPSRVRPG